MIKIKLMISLQKSNNILIQIKHFFVLLFFSMNDEKKFLRVQFPLNYRSLRGEQGQISLPRFQIIVYMN